MACCDESGTSECEANEERKQRDKGFAYIKRGPHLRVKRQRSGFRLRCLLFTRCGDDGLPFVSRLR